MPSSKHQPVKKLKQAKNSLTIADIKIKAGEKKQLELPVARLVTSNMLSLPLTVLHGSKQGPALFLSAAVHGDELNGIEIIRQVLAALNPETLAGTLYAVPVVNMFGFIDQSRYMPDRRDLNRSFPGALKGSLTSQLAKIFMTEVVERCEYGIDLHTGSNHRSNLPQVRISLSDDVSLKLAKAFAAPVILDASTRKGSLRAEAFKKNVRVILYEAGEAHRLSQDAIDTGVQGVFRVMTSLNMIDTETVLKKASLIARNSSWLRAKRSGIFQTNCKLGQAVQKKQVLGTLGNIMGEKQSSVLSNHNGVIIGKLEHPLVNRGDALLHIAEI